MASRFNENRPAAETYLVLEAAQSEIRICRNHIDNLEHACRLHIGNQKMVLEQFEKRAGMVDPT